MVERRRGSDRYENDSDDGYDSKSRRRTGHIMKILCPYYNAGAVIGKGGDRIKDVKERSGASIEISRHDARFPGTEERVISLQGEKDELQSAARYINERMREDDPPASSTRRSDEDNDRRRKTCRVIVCDSSMAMIIGRNGDNIRDLKKDHVVQINTSKRHETPRELDERIISIEGEDRDVDRCLDDIISQVVTDERSRMRFYVDYADFNRRYGRSYRRREDRESSHGGRRDRHGGRRSRDRSPRYRSRSRDRSRSYERRKSPEYRGGKRSYSRSRSRSR